jgi:PKHD-type hydroxylase
MLVQVAKALDDKQLAELREMLASEAYVLGTSTASGAAAQVKNNLQLPPESANTKQAGAYLLACLADHPLFGLAVQPRSFAQPLFSRYEPGMSYGQHLDAPLLHRGQTIRSDVAITVFLNGRDDYDGGELVVELGTESLRIKGDAGDCIVYPSSTLHSVTEVTRGVRLVSALWAQSLIRDPARREILYDLGCALQFYELMMSDSPYLDRLRKSYSNLFRLWAEL